MELELSNEHKAYLSSILDDMPDVCFSTLAGKHKITIEVIDKGTSPYNGPTEYNVEKVILVRDSFQEQRVRVYYHSCYGARDNGGCYDVVLEGPCTVEQLGKLLDIINAYKVSLTQKPSPIKEVISRVRNFLFS